MLPLTYNGYTKLNDKLKFETETAVRSLTLGLDAFLWGRIAEIFGNCGLGLDKRQYLWQYIVENAIKSYKILWLASK